MAFDPDEYLSEQAPAPAPAASGGFDPDAYLAESSATPERTVGTQQHSQWLAEQQAAPPAGQDPATASVFGNAEKPKKLALPQRQPSKLDKILSMASRGVGMGYAISPEPVQTGEQDYAVPSNLQVAQNALVKGVASVPDMVLNTPTNLLNLGKAGVGTIANLAGRPDLAPDITSNPDVIRSSLTEAGVINPAYEPQTQGQRILDVGIQGLVGGAMTGGGGGVKSLLANTLAGGTGAVASQTAQEAGLGTGAQLAAGLLAGGVTAAGANRATGATKNIKAQQQNQIVDEGFRKAKESGFVFPASQSNPESVVANAVDVLVGGRPRMQQAASIKNQAKVNELATKSLGVAEGTPITPDLLKSIRAEAVDTGYATIKNAGVVKTRAEYDAALDKLTEQARTAKKGFSAYDDSGLVKTVEQLRTKEFDAESGLAMIQQLRDDASGAYTRGDKSMGRALKGAAGAIEDEIEAHLATTGQEVALKTFRDARKQIAKTYSVEKALNEATGNVSATKLARQLERGAPLSGELRDIALAAKLPGASLADTKYATTGASQLEALAAMGGAVGTGNALLAALPIARGAGRRIALTRPVSNMLGTPNYNQARLTGQNVNALLMQAGLDAQRPEQ